MIIVVGVSCFALKLSTHVMPEFLCVLLALALFVALAMLFVVALLVGFIRWRETSRSWFVPALVCLVFILCSWYFASPIGQRISNWRFGKHFAEYSRVVDGFRGGYISCRTTCNAEFETVESTKIPGLIGLPKGLREIRGERCDDGGFALLFWLDTDVPLLHEGYIFKGYREKSNCNTGPMNPEKRWEIRHITGQWYHFSDQPGL
ncbi:MAG TPA: hypothetical protein VF865_12445 [Acidobacteriaceae bacterium]